MALIKCPECDLQVSDHAIACPHCGYPINTKVAKQQLNNLGLIEPSVRHG